MANRYAIATGNWSDTSIWNGGLGLPVPGDIVSANGFTVTIDQDIDVVKITTAAIAPALAGGLFLISDIATVRNVTGEVSPGTTTCLRVTATGGTLNFIGNVIFAGSTASIYGMDLQAAFAGVLNVTGNINGGGGTSDVGLYIFGPCTVTINGNVTAGTGTNAAYGVLDTTNPATITVNGNVYGGGFQGLTSTIASTITINGDIYAGGNNAGVNVSHASAVLDCNGGIYATNANYGVTTVATNVRIKGPMVNAPNNRMAFYGPFFMIHASQPSSWTINDDSSAPLAGIPVVLSNALEGIPAQADVRAGVQFGAGNTLTGTMEVPPAESVAYGIPVDQTEGTATLNLQDMANAVGSQVAQAVTTQ